MQSFAIERGSDRSGRAKLRVTTTRMQLLSCLAGCLTFVAALRAEAQVYRLAVLELGTEHVDDALARRLSEEIREAIKAHRHYDLQESRVSLEQLSLANDCDAETPACLERIARKLKVNGIVYGRVTKDSGAALANVQRYDLAARKVRGSALATLALTGVKNEDIEKKADQLVTDLFELEPARSPFARGQVLQPEQEADLQLMPPDSDGINVRQVAGYALLGGAVVSAGMSVLSFVEIDRAQSNETFERYRRNVGQMRPSVRDVCDEAGSGQNYGLDAVAFQKVKSSCQAGRTFEILQFIFIGGAVLSGGLSAYLLLGDSSREKPGPQTSRLTIRPTVYKSGGGLGARITF